MSDLNREDHEERDGDHAVAFRWELRGVQFRGERRDLHRRPGRRGSRSLWGWVCARPAAPRPKTRAVNPDPVDADRSDPHRCPMSSSTLAPPRASVAIRHRWFIASGALAPPRTSPTCRSVREGATRRLVALDGARRRLVAARGARWRLAAPTSRRATAGEIEPADVVTVGSSSSGDIAPGHVAALATLRAPRRATQRRRRRASLRRGGPRQAAGLARCATRRRSAARPRATSRRGRSRPLGDARGLSGTFAARPRPRPLIHALRGSGSHC